MSIGRATASFVQDRRFARQAPLALAAAAAAVLAAAYGFEYIGGLEPCVLCLYQRAPYAAVIALGLLAAALWQRPRAQAVVLGLCALAFAGNAALAGYHVGVEQGWFAGPDSCSGGGTVARTVDELRAQILGQPVVRCDEPAWTLFGMSLSGLNGLASVALAGAAALSARLVWRG